MSKITHNISLSYIPKTASYFMDIIIHQKFLKICLICFAFKFKMEGDNAVSKKEIKKAKNLILALLNQKHEVVYRRSSLD